MTDAVPLAGRPETPSTYGIHSDDGGMLPWEWARRRLEEARNYWLATAGPDGLRAGSNSLYSVNLYTGAVSHIGVFNIGGVPLAGSGISGLAIIPEPTALAMMAIAALGFVRRRRTA